MFHVKQDADVIVVGGGHAGTEAALAAARMGVRTLLVTHRFDRIGEMSCNPAIGGLGKGHIVREIDALDGAMGRAADAAAIQYRLLNRSKGAAVQGPRTQADRDLYRAAVQALVREQDSLDVIEASVEDIVLTSGSVQGVFLGDGTQLTSKSVVLTTGTFLRGIIHIGHERRPAGRMGDAAVTTLAQRLQDLGLPLGRLKTGTPPRLAGRTIDWAQLDLQPADKDPVFFSFLTQNVAQPQVACGLTATTEETHALIRDNLMESSVYGGSIAGRGPRYCPSIEDKVVRFADRPSHQVFLEPETLSGDVVYPNGISTSLPPEIQEQMVRSMRGLARAEILQHGYAIEYDYIDPRSLTRSLSVRDAPGLYLAGQINGTTGYEEAGGQGLVAGVNAALRAQGMPAWELGRDEAYIGVMIDDLVTQGVSEPYRMFTSRAEYRLSLRADNADQRLTPVGTHVGCVSDERRAAFEQKSEALERGRKALATCVVSPRDLSRLGADVAQNGKKRSAMDALAVPDVSFDRLAELFPALDGVEAGVRAQLEREAQYVFYIQRQDKEVAALRRDESLRISPDFDYGSLSGLSNELLEKLEAVRPDTLAQAGRINGMTPACLTLILAHVRRRDARSA
ncbi:MAG: tRNA uridine-5-carboxymethylaminomethyl(34) synthesis enzyme MnmG [Pseudomonadota bacterium]